MDYPPEFARRFHPDHLADLARSGLTQETIAALGIHTVRPGDIPRLVGWDPPGVTSALAFPYPGEDGFARLKVFPPFTAKDGQTVKYLQRPGTGVHLYITPSARAVLADPTIPLTFTEGEKKAAALHQAGIPAVGLGGLWNWLEHGLPIAALDRIAWAEREALLDFDSDVWSRPELLCAVYTFGREIEDRGAQVRVRRIPPLSGQRAGADDFLLAGGVEAHRALSTLPLTHKAFTHAKRWHKGWVARRPAPAPSLEALLQQLSPRPHLRFPQDLWEDHLFYGVGSGDQAALLTSARTLIPISHLAGRAEITAPRRPRLPLSRSAVSAFLGGATEQTPALLRDLADHFARYMVWPGLHWPWVLACWVLGTHCYQLFPLFPYLIVTSPTKRCGKSRVLELVAAVGFACRGVTTSPTEASLFRGAELYGGVECLDEVETLASPGSERAEACRAILNAGHQKGATVPRVQKQPDGTQDLEEFHVYRPRALAAVLTFAETLEDRGITITLQRKSPGQEVARLSGRRLHEAAARLRDRSATWALGHAWDLAGRFAALEDPEELRDLDDRARDLWEPLWLIAEQARFEGAPEAMEALRAAVQEAASQRRAAELDTSLAALLDALLEVCPQGELIITPKDLLEEIQRRMGKDAPQTSKRLGNFLRRLGLPRARRRLERRSSNVYILQAEVLEGLQARYAPASEEKEAAPGTLA